ncbi:MAG TPA: twin-arginine translocase subunit TatC [Chloroflexota bacterium]|nr:twin-arginine translocase subunit TatC [Chloroflexota bacterium]
MAETTAEHELTDEEKGVMSLRGHLLELRSRMTIAAIAVMACSLILWPFKDFVFEVLQSPLPSGSELQQITPTESFFTFIKISLMFGVGVSSPLVVYQMLAFISPGLYPNERRMIYYSLPAVAGLFFIGAMFAWFVVLNFTLGFLTNFSPEDIRTSLSVSSFADFVTKILLAVGLVFETPLVIFLLARLRIVSTKRLQGFRRYAIVVIVIIAAVITPTPDPFTQMTVAIPMYLLYELGVLLSRLAVPSREEDLDSDPDLDSSDAGTSAS